MHYVNQKPAFDEQAQYLPLTAELTAKKVSRDDARVALREAVPAADDADLEEFLRRVFGRGPDVTLSQFLGFSFLAQYEYAG